MQVEDHLTEIMASMAKGERAEPERQLMALMSQMGPATLSEWRSDIERIIREFQKKRRGRLRQRLHDGIEGISEPELDGVNSNKVAESLSIAPESALPITSDLLAEFRDELDFLRVRHIFQWSTFYRDCLNSNFDRFLDAMDFSSESSGVNDVAELLADHTRTVFSQGYDYIRSAHNHDHAIKKSISGLSQFLALPLDFYSARSSSASDYRSAVALRLLFSASVSGILEGYSSVRFGRQTGQAILPRWQRQWMHYVAFLTPQHAKRIINCLESEPLKGSLESSVLPLLEALQRFFLREKEDYWPMPVLGQFSWLQRRIDISFRPPRSAAIQRLVELSAFLEVGFVRVEDLDDALGRQAVLILVPLKPDVRKIVAEREGLKAIVVPAGRTTEGEGEVGSGSPMATADQAFRVLDDALYKLRSKLRSNAPITYNFAREFPLQHPERASFFHVTRSSIRDLLRTFERRNGVRLWCSVRRSGKTMACLDMETTTGVSKTIPQTCGASMTNAAASDATAFYDQVRRAVESGRMVPRTFISDLVAECAQFDVRERRTVLIIDEYETLFGLLKNAAIDSEGVRYRAVQPVLDQLVEFSRENLLVFLGQQPDAHFILMDQNQLAPYVTQDSFPLFEHVPGAATGEFSELVNKILAGRIECAAGFLDLLFEETAGHPFLTVNVLVEFVEWLITEERPQLGLQVREGDFSEFSRGKLNANRMLLSSDYEFFRRAAAAALSAQGYSDNPWLYFVYWVLRLLASESPDTSCVSRHDFEELVGSIPVPEGGRRPECSEVLRTASHSNFLSYDDLEVRVKVRTLGRIAAAVQPETV